MMRNIVSLLSIGMCTAVRLSRMQDDVIDPPTLTDLLKTQATFDEAISILWTLDHSMAYVLQKMTDEGIQQEIFLRAAEQIAKRDKVVWDNFLTNLRESDTDERSLQDLALMFICTSGMPTVEREKKELVALAEKKYTQESDVPVFEDLEEALSSDVHNEDDKNLVLICAINEVFSAEFTEKIEANLKDAMLSVMGGFFDEANAADFDFNEVFSGGYSIPGLQLSEDELIDNFAYALAGTLPPGVRWNLLNVAEQLSTLNHSSAWTAEEKTVTSGMLSVVTVMCKRDLKLLSKGTDAVGKYTSAIKVLGAPEETLNILLQSKLYIQMKMDIDVKKIAGQMQQMERGVSKETLSKGKAFASEDGRYVLMPSNTGCWIKYIRALNIVQTERELLPLELEEYANSDDVLKRVSGKDLKTLYIPSSEFVTSADLDMFASEQRTKFQYMGEQEAGEHDYEYMASSTTVVQGGFGAQAVSVPSHVMDTQVFINLTEETDPTAIKLCPLLYTYSAAKLYSKLHKVEDSKEWFSHFEMPMSTFKKERVNLLESLENWRTFSAVILKKDLRLAEQISKMSEEDLQAALRQWALQPISHDNENLSDQYTSLELRIFRCEAVRGDIQSYLEVGKTLGHSTDGIEIEKLDKFLDSAVPFLKKVYLAVDEVTNAIDAGKYLSNSYSLLNLMKSHKTEFAAMPELLAQTDTFPKLLPFLQEKLEAINLIGIQMFSNENSSPFHDIFVKKAVYEELKSFHPLLERAAEYSLNFVKMAKERGFSRATGVTVDIRSTLGYALELSGQVALSKQGSLEPFTGEESLEESLAIDVVKLKRVVEIALMDLSAADSDEAFQSVYTPLLADFMKKNSVLVAEYFGPSSFSSMKTLLWFSQQAISHSAQLKNIDFDIKRPAVGKTLNHLVHVMEVVESALEEFSCPTKDYAETIINRGLSPDLFPLYQAASLKVIRSIAQKLDFSYTQKTEGKCSSGAVQAVGNLLNAQITEGSYMSVGAYRVSEEGRNAYLYQAYKASTELQPSVLVAIAAAACAYLPGEKVDTTSLHSLLQTAYGNRQSLFGM